MKYLIPAAFSLLVCSQSFAKEEFWFSNHKPVPVVLMGYQHPNFSYKFSECFVPRISSQRVKPISVDENGNVLVPNNYSVVFDVNETCFNESHNQLLFHIVTTQENPDVRISSFMGYCVGDTCEPKLRYKYVDKYTRINAHPVASGFEDVMISEVEVFEK